MKSATLIRGVRGGSASLARAITGGMAYNLQKSNLRRKYLRVRPSEPQWIDVGMDVIYNVESNADLWIIQ